MIKIIDTYPQINSLFENESFNLKKWEGYINAIYQNSADIFKKDLYGDVGYYLGTRLVQDLCNKFSLEQLVKMTIDDVYNAYLEFVEKHR